MHRNIDVMRNFLVDDSCCSMAHYEKFEECVIQLNFMAYIKPLVGLLGKSTKNPVAVQQRQMVNM